MRNTILLFTIIMLELACNAHAQPDSLWSRTYGGRNLEFSKSIVQTEDGGFVLGGDTWSFGAGVSDFWLLKINAEGDSIWSHTFGGDTTDRVSSIIRTEDGGFALAGNTSSFGAGESDFWFVKTDEEGDSLWSRTYGGEERDGCSSIIQTDDGGFLLAGYTLSYGAGESDFWIVKTNAEGDSLWSKTYGGEEWDACYSIILTDDGGFALSGHTNSFGVGECDFWLVKTDAEGDSLWSNTYGGNSIEWYASLIQVEDGGYVLAGDTYSFGEGGRDFWLVRTNSEGDSLWSNTYGGDDDDEFTSIIQTRDDGFALAGRSLSFGSDRFDLWIVKTNSDGNTIWSSTFGGDSTEWCGDIIQTRDNGFALVGATNSFGAGDLDIWLIRIESEWYPLISRTFGGEESDICKSIISTNDGGFALAGYTYSFGSGESDFWLVKTNEEGDSLWSGTFGTPVEEWCSSFIQTNDGGYALVGSKAHYLHSGLYDFWLVITNEDGDSLWSRTFGGENTETCSSISPAENNGFILAGDIGRSDILVVKIDDEGEIIWSNTYGGESMDGCSEVIITEDGGYALGGWTESFGSGGFDFWLMKTNDDGDSLWSHTYGGEDDDFCSSLIQTEDGGFALVGYTRSFGEGGDDFWFVKTNADGDSLWSCTFGGAESDRCNSTIQLTDSGFALVGYTRSFGLGIHDLYLVRIDNDGEFLYSRTFGGRNRDVCTSIIPVRDDSFALCGYTGSFGAGEDDFLLIKIGSELLSVPNVGKKIFPDKFTLLPTYPNPFNATTTINYELLFTSRVLIQVFNLSGRSIATLVDANIQPGFHSVLLKANNLPSGLYFVRLEATGQIHSQKIMLVK